MLKIIRILVFVALAGIILFSAYNVFLKKPSVYNLSELEKLPKRKEVSLIIKPRAYVQEITVKAVQGKKEVIIFSGKLPEKTNEIKLLIEPAKLGLKDGPATIEVSLKRFYILKDTFTVQSIIDTKPPRINILFAPYVVLQGGSGGIKIRTNEDVRASVIVGDREFKFFRVGERTYITIFGVPPETSVKETIKIVAFDEVGNKTTISLGTGIRRNRFKRVNVELSKVEEKLRPKLETILGNGEDLDFITLFKKVNEEIREENEKKISEIGLKSVEEKLWEGKFLQLKRSKVLSKYGEIRRYYYKGKFISMSRHLGYDLASVRNAPVTAANSGIVVFAGDLGIYGNTIIIDHGYGLMSLYAHLSDFKVKEGDKVKKGQIIGITGETGLAFGDHLHFGILVQGLEVTPLEWWDHKWIKTRIEPLFED